LSARLGSLWGEVAQLVEVHEKGGPAAWYGIAPARLPERLLTLYGLVEGAIDRFTAEVRASPGHERAKKAREAAAKGKTRR
jgi:hypothetical protein